MDTNIETQTKSAKVESTFAIIRHLLTAVGGALMATGYLTNEELNEIIASYITITGSISFLIGSVWSIIDKIKRR